MNIFGRLFGSDEHIGKLVDGAYNGIDKIVYTDEEKADHFKKLLTLYEPFKITQRLLAVIFGSTYCAGWIIAFCAGFQVSVESQLEMLNGTMGQITLAIVAFYFMGGTINSLLNKSA